MTDQRHEDDIARITEMVAQAADEVLTSLDGVLAVDWNDLGEVTIITDRCTFRATFMRLGDDD